MKLQIPILSLLGISISFASDPLPANSPVAHWLSSQTNIQAWSADFIQTRSFKSLTQPLIETGHVWFAEPNRFRWELAHPPKTIAVRAADEMLLFYPRLKLVERYPLTGNQTGQWRDALSLLEAGFPRSQSELESRFRILSQTVTNDVCKLALQPKAATARRIMPQIKIEFSTTDLSLRATELQIADGARLRNDFTNAVLNPKIEPEIFSPKIEADFRVTEPLKPK